MITIVQSVRLRAQAHKSIIHCHHVPSWFARVILRKKTISCFYIGHKTVWERLPELTPCDKKFSASLFASEKRWQLAKDLGITKK
jgi:hypothetical protein